MGKVITVAADRSGLRPPASRPAVVVTDAGDRASLVLLGPETAVAAGTRFRHQGRWWEIRGRRPDSRVLVADLVPGDGFESA